MATKTIKISDLSGEDIPEEQLARLVVEEHPELTESVTLEVLPSEVEGQLPEAQNYVRVTYFPPTESGGAPRNVILSLEEFNTLSQTADMGTVLNNALLQQQEQEGRRRGRRGRRRAGERRQRIDYASPEHAGMPHRGRITDAEKQYVQNNLDEVNKRRERAGHDPIDPTDPKMAEKYGLSAQRPDAVEAEMQDQANL